MTQARLRRLSHRHLDEPTARPRVGRVPTRLGCMRLVFAGTPTVAADTLRTVLDDSNHDVVAVLTRPDAPQGRSSRPVPSPVADLATERGIEVLKPARAKDPELAERLAELAPQCCPVVAYGGLIPQALLNVPDYGWVNVHYSLLPRWRGAAPVQHAILAGDAVTGVTVFGLVAELDAGDILGQREFALSADATSGSVLAALQPLGAQTLLEVLGDLEHRRAQARPQPSEGITVAPKLTVAQARLDWHSAAVELDRRIRANNPAPIAWTEFGGQRCRILSARLVEDVGLEPGELLAQKRRLLVGTGNGTLELLSVQPAGKKALAGADWGRGLHHEGRFE